MAPVILVFAKAPVPGRVKTRLQPVLSAEAAATLHCSIVGDVLERLKGFRPEVDVILYLDHDTDVFGDVPRRLQQGSDLGAKMWNAAAEQFASGRSQVLLIGTDSPDLPASHLRQLLASEADVAFGPAEDGGYYAVMFRKLPPGLFDGVRWSSEYALADSIAAAERCGLRVGLGGKWYDIDKPADLERLAGAPELPQRTRAWLEANQFLSKCACCCIQTGMALKEGSKAPDFTLLTDAGEKFKLSSLKGKNVILYFYPKSDTPGCTTEACEFRDAYEAYANSDAVVIGVSPDPVKAQAKFRTKHKLPFTILADEEHAVAEKYGVWVEKSMYGKKYMGVERSTFLINKEGKIAKIFSKVKPAGHAEEVLTALAAI